MNPTGPTMAQQARSLEGFAPRHFRFELDGRRRIGTITLNRPERKNPLTFESYAELREFMRDLRYISEVRALVITGAGENFCSGGDVHEIIGPLTQMSMPELLEFTRMTGDLVLAMRRCPQPVIAAIDGIAAGAGAMIALASDLRVATPRSRAAFLFTRVGLAGCDMGACTLLPRLIGQGRAAELLYTGRALAADEGLSWGFFNQIVAPEALLAHSQELAASLALGPSFAHAMTKTMLHQEWNMSLEQALEAEAQAQAVCMQSEDFRRAYHAFAAKEPPLFEGN
jgi:enoyl-CoA hydratase/carnithine racemase